MRVQTRMAGLLVAGLFLLAAAPARADSLTRLAKTLEKGLKGKENKKVAVLGFPYHDGRVSSGSTLIQEKLTTYLAGNGKVDVIERKLLDKVLAEMKLGTTGLLDQKTTSELGKVLGVAALVTGTLNDLDDRKTEVNARLIATETGRILSAKLIKLKRTWEDAPVPAHSPVTVVSPPLEPSKPFLGKALVQVAILLDTSNSMDGLIQQAKTQLWKVVNELAITEKGGEASKIQVALYQYGNSDLDLRSGYIRQVTPFTSDLDKVSEQLFALRTNGGSEHAGQVIDRALTDLDWAPQSDVYKAIFIAGNEPFTQGPVDFRGAVARAKSKSVFVNTIFCGDRQQGVSGQWQAGALQAGGEYLNIDQDRIVVALHAPQDKEIERIGRELNETYIPYAPQPQRREAQGRANRQDAAAEAFTNAGSSVERALFKGQRQYSAGRGVADAVTLMEEGKMTADDFKEENLPAEIRTLGKEERAKIIQEKAGKRKLLQRRMEELDIQRRAYLKEQEKTTGKTLGSAIIGTVRSQARQKNFGFSR